MPTQSDPSVQRTILYIEDNAANLALVEQLIARRSDWKLLSAVNAKLGLQLACCELPDVILMDINLPGLSGLDALRCLRDAPATCNIPVMALSSDAYPCHIEKGIAAGFSQYLTKPFEINEFMAAIDTCLAAPLDVKYTSPRSSPGPNAPP